MSALAFLFPGQGEQRPGILHELPASGTEVLADASRVLGEDPLGLDAPSALQGTRASQLVLLLSAVAWHRDAVEHGLAPDYLAGHSVGAWAAAVGAGSLALADAIRLVDLRARAMADCPPGGMLVSSGLSVRAVRAAVEQASAMGAEVWTSNVNAPTQVAVSGTVRGLDVVAGLLRAHGALRTVRLRVPVAAHSPLMAPAAEVVRVALAGTPMCRPTIPVAGNVTGQTIRTAEHLRADLADAIERPVQWATATAILAERGVGRWVQLPPGHTLAHLARDLPDADVWAVDEIGMAEVAARVRRRA